MSEAQALKDAGQQQSLGILLDSDVTNFERIVRSYEVGKELSINTLRAELDALEIPVSARGGLFRRAVSRGWLAPAMVVHRGREFPVTEPSTGYSAHRAHVRVYVRTDPDSGR